MSKIIELAKKIKELADRGIDGEKVNAEKMLNDFLKKHNITIEDIEGEKEYDYYFNFNKEEVKFFNQIYKSISPKGTIYGPLTKQQINWLGGKGNYMIRTTISSFIEVEWKYNIYKNMYKKELDTFRYAFYMANGLLGKADEDRKPTAEEIEKHNKALRMARDIEVAKLNKQITSR